MLLFFFWHFLGSASPLARGWQNLTAWSSSQLMAGRLAEQSSDLKAEVNYLRQQLTEIIIEAAYLNILEEENRQLRQYFDFTKETDLELILAHVVARQSVLGLRGQEQNLIIDKGADQGLVPGLAVSNEAGAIIGKIVAVKEKSSLVCLITANNCRLAATILNQSNSLGLTDGQLGLTVSLDMIPQTEEIQVGDIVTSSGLSDLIPRGLVIGQVKQVDRKSNEIWQTAVIEPTFSLNNLNILAVVLP